MFQDSGKFAKSRPEEYVQGKVPVEKEWLKRQDLKKKFESSEGPGENNWKGEKG